jgi:hypothetical protein
MTELVPLVFTSGWASGINPYLVVLLTGLAGRLTDLGVPDALMRTDVLIAAGALATVDFIADKIAYVDSTWDAVNTVIRPTAGAVIALLLSGDATTLEQAVLATTGGTTAFASHAVKSGVRLAVNTSPEPASNVVVSLLEDVMVTFVVLLAMAAPWVAAAIALALLLFGIVLILLMWQGIQRVRAARRERRGSPST